jgi:membrane glycosyltransferase
LNTGNATQKQNTAWLKASGLPMPAQNFAEPFVDQAVPGIDPSRAPRIERAFLWCLPVLCSLPFFMALHSVFRRDGSLSSAECILLILTTLLFTWECLPAMTSFLGLLSKPRATNRQTQQSLHVAILLTMYDEDAETVIGNSTTLMRSLSKDTRHTFELYILSDSRNENSIVAEMAMLHKSDLVIHYHNRRYNTDHKSGNIREWVERDAAPFDAMLILDADSQMTCKCVLQLVDHLAAEPACGLVQSMPKVLRGDSLWQWTQSFATGVYGQTLALGMARWMGNEANYYGHNAIIRTKAFAACAGLPRLRPDIASGETIMSHDFVEAALIRRAGWGVKFLADVGGSFEETPRTLMGFIKRDSRWCHGNLQHLQILGAAGLHGLSRWHLFHGAMTYFTSILWFATLLLWARLINVNSTPPLTLSHFDFRSFSLIASIAFVILVPKIFALIAAMKRNPKQIWSAVFLRNVVLEILLSTLVAPTLMLQRVLMIARYATGSRCIWLPSSTKHRGVLTTLRFHAFETMVGLGLLLLAAMAQLSLLILPVALCLCFSWALSLLFSLRLEIKSPHTSFEENFNHEH